MLLFNSRTNTHSGEYEKHEETQGKNFDHYISRDSQGKFQNTFKTWENY